MSKAPHLLQIFRDRHACFAGLLELAKFQQQFVEADEYPQLLSLLGRKQQIIGRLEAIGKAQPRLWDDWRAERDGAASAARQACEETLAQTEALLAELLEHERVSTETLAKRRDQTAAQLRAVASGSRVNTAYRDSLAAATHRHLDTDL